MESPKRALTSGLPAKEGGPACIFAPRNERIHE
jgi:hypothetical protein